MALDNIDFNEEDNFTYNRTVDFEKDSIEEGCVKNHDEQVDIEKHYQTDIEDEDDSDTKEEGKEQSIGKQQEQTDIIDNLLKTEESDKLMDDSNAFVKGKPLVDADLDILKIENLRKYYRAANKYVLNNLSFTVRTNDIVGIIGINGAGKTTLFKSILGVSYAEGVIEIAGVSNESAPATVGVLWVENGFDGELTLLENYKFYYNVYGLQYDETEARELLREFGIGQLAITQFKYLSTGQKRKAAIMRTFIKRSPLYLLDEPTSGLDIVSQSRFNTILKKHLNSNQAGCMLITHNYKDLEDLCNKMLILNGGAILDYDTVDRIHEKYLNGYILKGIINNDAESKYLIESVLSNTGVSFYMSEGTTVANIYIKIPDLIAFKPSYENLKRYLLHKTIEKLSLKTFVDIILAGVNFK